MGEPFSKTIMGTGTTLRFHCTETTDALLSILTLDDERQFLDVGVSFAKCAT
jgi:hypothetical protein